MTCPDADVLAAFLDGGLSEGERLRMEEHVDGCVECAASSFDLAGPSSSARTPSRMSRSSMFPCSQTRNWADTFLRCPDARDDAGFRVVDYGLHPIPRRALKMGPRTSAT